MIGAGLLGLSAAWSLSRRGWSVDVLEAADGIGHPLAGSKGDVRIFRLGYPDPKYVAMAIESRARWRELEASTGRNLLHVTGQLSFGDAESVEAVADSLTRHGERVEWLTASEARARFEGVALAGPSLLEPESGVLAAGECLRALGEAALFDVRLSVPVTRLETDDGGVTVQSADGRSLHTDVVVNCAGPHALALLGHDAHPVGALPSLPQVAYFRGAATSGTDPARLPVFIDWGDAMIYGLPVLRPGARAGTFKVSHHTPGPALAAYDPAAAKTPGLDADDPTLLAALTGAVRRLLPGLDPEPVATERCFYDNSADGDFVLDRVGNVVVGCGTSGHGFKFGPLLGELLADLAEGTTPSFDLRPFRIDRIDRIDQADRFGQEQPPDQRRSASR